MNPHRPKKPASDEYTSDEEEMIVYDMEDEIESNPDYVKENVILSMDELYLDQAPQDINKEFHLERVRLQAFVAATDPGCKKELIRSGSLVLLR
ncbi:hypothetical protein TNCV_4190121 [Trichonephila clavipes]|nr:hypothetical protein TNCV_4190121 [Trichonephila clavipes]